MIHPFLPPTPVQQQGTGTGLRRPGIPAAKVIELHLHPSRNGEALQPDFSANTLRIFPLQGNSFQGTCSVINPQDTLDAVCHNPEIARKYLDALKGEVAFREKRKLPLGPVSPEQLQSMCLKDLHSHFCEHGIGHVGLRRIEFGSDGAQADAAVVPHPLYVMVNRAASAMRRTQGANLGAAIILETADGHLIVQYRGSKNKVYGEIPGASAAGLVNAAPFAKEVQPGKTFSLEQFVQRHMVEEFVEELGAKKETLRNLRPSSLMIDTLALHHEMTFTGKLSLTADELIQAAWKKREQCPDTEFKESFLLLPGSAENLEKLIFDFQLPLPPTHAGPYLMVLREKIGEQAFHELWERRRTDFEAKYAKYDPNIPSSQQGLPTFLDEVRRLYHGTDWRFVPNNRQNP